MKKNLIKYIYIIGLLYLFIACKKDDIDDNYRIVKKGNLTQLVVLPYAQHIIGIDTNDFSLSAQITIDNASLGGVCKTNDGGLVFTHQGWVSSNKSTNMLYFVDKNCKRTSGIQVHERPTEPIVFDNLVCLGSSVICDGLTYNFQIFDIGKKILLKEYKFRSLIESFLVYSYDNDIYIPISPEERYLATSTDYSYIQIIDKKSLDTTSIRAVDDFFVKGLHLCKQGNKLYLFRVVAKRIAIFDLITNKLLLEKDMLDIPAISILNARNCHHPRIWNGNLVGFLSAFDNDGKMTVYWAKFDINTLDLLDLKKIETYGGGTQAANMFYSGRYFVIPGVQNLLNLQHVVFVNIADGTESGYVKIEAPYF